MCLLLQARKGGSLRGQAVRDGPTTVGGGKVLTIVYAARGAAWPTAAADGSEGEGDGEESAPCQA
jgi:hypothetical protein